MQNKSAVEQLWRACLKSDSISLRYPRKIASINALFKTNLKFCIKIVPPDQEENWWRQCCRHNEKIDITFIAQVATHQEVWPKHDSTYGSSNFGGKGVFAMPRSILRIWIRNFTPVYESHLQRYLPFFILFYFYYNKHDFCIFLYFWIGHIFLGEKGQDTSVSISAWTTPCQNFKVQIRRIDRGVTNLPNKECLGWPKLVSALLLDCWMEDLDKFGNGVHQKFLNPSQ